MKPLWTWNLWVALAMCVGTFPCGAVQVTYYYDMERPIDWADVSMEWGLGGKVGYVYEEPGNPGKALHITTTRVTDPVDPCDNEGRGASVANEGRAIQWNHKPGTTATISFDFRVFSVPRPFDGWFRAYYFDGYVTAEFFQENLFDPQYDLLANQIMHWNAGYSQDWVHYEVTTHVLQQPVLTMWIQAANPVSTAGWFNAALDNLRVTVELSETYYDPGFEWGATGQVVIYDKMLTCRRSDTCRAIAWCDLMYDERAQHSASIPQLINYGTMNIFRDTSSRPTGGVNLKHDYWHRSQEPQAGGASVIGFASIHGEAAAKSMGLRQTVSYTAFGLAPGQGGLVTVHAKGTSVFGDVNSIPQNSYNRRDGPGGRTLLGVDPYGGVISQDPRVLWTDEATTAIEYEGWHVHTIQFQRPPDANAMTVFIKWRDGQAHRPGVVDCDDQGISPGNTGWFDYAIVRVTPAALPTATPTPTACIVDTDGDRVCDPFEVGNLEIRLGDGRSNLLIADSDGDGLKDGEEDRNSSGRQNSGETATRNADSDGDRIEDGLEALLGMNPLVMDPGFADADNDRLPDAQDPDNANADSDGDRFDDLYDAVALKTLSAASNALLKPSLADLNGDGEITNLDALLAQSIFLVLAGPNDPAFDTGPVHTDGFRFADPNRDGLITNVDGLLIQSFFLLLVHTLPLRY